MYKYVYNFLSEYARAAYHLRNSESTQEALFLKNYSLYLAGEKQRHEESMELEGIYVCIYLYMYLCMYLSIYVYVYVSNLFVYLYCVYMLIY